MLLTNHAPRPRPHLHLVTDDFVPEQAIPSDLDTDVMLDGARLILATILLDPVPCSLDAAELCRHRACITDAIRLDLCAALDALAIQADDLHDWFIERARRGEHF